MNLLLTNSMLEKSVIVGMIALGAVTLCVVVWALFVKQHSVFLNFRYRFKKIELYATGKDLCRTMLDNLGLIDVEVEKVSFWSYWFRANTYSAKNKKIYLSRRHYEKNRVAAVATTTTLVGLAKLDADGDKAAKNVGRIAFIQLAMALIIPFVMLGVIIDFSTIVNPGLVSLILAFVGLALFLVLFIISLTAVRAMKKASVIANELIDDLNILNENELKISKKLIKMNYKLYLATVILSVLFIAKMVINILWNIIKLNSKNKR